MSCSKPKMPFAALGLLAEKRAAVLFTDVVMPGEIDGPKLARAALARWPSLKILLTSGHEDAVGLGHVRDFRLLVKPYRSADLARVLREAIDGDKPSRP